MNWLMSGARRVRSRIALIPGAICLMALAAIAGGCAGDADPQVAPVQLSGNITIPDGAESTGTVHVSLYHAWALTGDLRHPVEFIEAFETQVGSFTHEFDYPVDLGEGLLVYAWIDDDGDGTLCTPTDRGDRAGLIEITDFVPGPVSADVELYVPCAGPDWFYPAPE